MPDGRTDKRKRRFQLCNAPPQPINAKLVKITVNPKL